MDRNEFNANNLPSIVDGKEIPDILKQGQPGQPGQPVIQASSGELIKASSIASKKQLLESEVIKAKSQRSNRPPGSMKENVGPDAEENHQLGDIHRQTRSPVSQLFNPAQLLKPAGGEADWKESKGDGDAVVQTLDLNDLFQGKRKRPGPEVPVPKEQPKTGDRLWANWVNPAFTPAAKVTPMDSGSQKDGVDGASFEGLGSILQATNSNLKLNRQKFEDKQFPAELKSIAGNGDIEMRDQYRQYVWRRPQEIFGENFALGSAGVEPNDVMQGFLGDCYFICAMAALAEKSERAKRVMLTKQVSEEGVYSVALCITGVWEEVILDDRFPCDPRTNKPAFSQSRSNDLWVMLLEKAWAKVHGGYLNIESGFTSEALFSLTGAPVYTYFVSSKNSEKNWAAILEGETSNYIMTASTSDFTGSGNDAQDKQTGLSANHGYSLLAGITVKHQGKDLKLVKLRNPWGKGEWKGDWSDRSPLWTPELKAQLGVQERDDGIFFMTFDDWQTYFSNFDVCYYHDSFKHSAIKLQTDPEVPTVIRFTLTESSPYYFMVSQTNSRMFRKADGYFYSGLTLVVCRVDKEEVQYVGDANECDELLWFKSDCQPGEYLAYIMTPWRSIVNEFSFAVYGPERAKFKLCPPASISENFIAAALCNKARGNSGRFNSFAASGEPDIKCFYEINREAISYFYFENSSVDTTLKSRVVFTEMEDVFVFPPHTARPVESAPGADGESAAHRQFEVSHTVDPRGSGIVMCKMNSDRSRLQVAIYSSFENPLGCPECSLI